MVTFVSGGANIVSQNYLTLQQLSILVAFKSSFNVHWISRAFFFL